MTIDQALRDAIDARVASGESLYSIANGCGVSLTILGRFVRGERSLRIDNASKLFEYLGVEIKMPRKRKR